MSTTLHTADRSISITVDDYGLLRRIELRGNLSPSRLNRELCRLHGEALSMPEQQGPSESDLAIAYNKLHNTTAPYLAELYSIIEANLDALGQAKQAVSSYQGTGKNDAVSVTLTSYGKIDNVTCLDKASRLNAEELAEAIIDAYQKALGDAQQFSQEWSNQLTSTLMEINPLKVVES